MRLQDGIPLQIPSFTTTPDVAVAGAGSRCEGGSLSLLRSKARALETAVKNTWAKACAFFMDVICFGGHFIIIGV
jgi:hypothetical protein